MAPPASHGEQPFRILLVDDSPQNRALVRAFLAETSLQVEEAEDGDSALRAFRVGHFDLVFMDLAMKGVDDGLKATREIRRWEEEMGRDPTPVIALTAQPAEGLEGGRSQHGFDGYLAKPVKRTRFLEVVQKYVEKTLDRNGAREVGEARSVQESSIIEELIPEFLEATHEDLSALERALRQEDMEEVRMLAHRISGGGAGFGFPKISTLGAALEEKALAGEAEQATRLTEELRAYLGRVQDAYFPGKS